MDFYNKFRKFLAAGLAVILLFTSMPVTVMAHETAVAPQEGLTLLATDASSIVGQGTGFNHAVQLADLTSQDVTAIEFNANRWISAQTATNRQLSYFATLSSGDVVAFRTRSDNANAIFSRLNFGIGGTVAQATAGGDADFLPFSPNVFNTYSSVLTPAPTADTANAYTISLAIESGKVSGSLEINGTPISSLDFIAPIPTETTITGVYAFVHNNAITIEHSWALYGISSESGSGDTGIIQEPEAAPEYAPQNLIAGVGSSGTVNLRWDAVPGATKYHIYQNSLTTARITTTSNTHFSVTDLIDDDEVVFYVIAANEFGTGPAARVTATPTLIDLNLEANAWLESIYAYWQGAPGATYNVYVREIGASNWHFVNNPSEEVVGQTNWTNDHSPLARMVDTTTNLWRVDVPGLAAMRDYELKVVEVESGREEVISGLIPVAFDRQGFAFDPTSPFGSTTGAHNADGTLRSDTVVMYVTAENVNTFTTPWGTVGIGGTDGLFHENNVRNRTGANAGAMNDATPVAIRFIGDIPTPATVRTGDMIRIARSANFTFEGIGTDAIINGWGLNVMSSNVIIRNLTFTNYPDDAINLEGWGSSNGQWPTASTGLLDPSVNIGNRISTNIWVTQNTFIDTAHGDGAVDASNNSSYFTISWNRVYDGGRLANLGSTQNNIRFRGSLHHNYVSNNESRVPRVRWGQVHFYNNVIDGANIYAIGAGHHANVIAEGNYFVRANRPMIISNQGSSLNGNNNTLTGDFPGYLLTSLTTPQNHPNNARGTEQIFTLATSLVDNAFGQITTFDPTVDQGLPAVNNTREAQPFAFFNPRELNMNVQVSTAEEALEIVPQFAGVIGTDGAVIDRPEQPHLTLTEGVVGSPSSGTWEISENGDIHFIGVVPGGNPLGGSAQNHFHTFSTTLTEAEISQFEEIFVETDFSATTASTANDRSAAGVMVRALNAEGNPANGPWMGEIFTRRAGGNSQIVFGGPNGAGNARGVTQIPMQGTDWLNGDNFTLRLGFIPGDNLPTTSRYRTTVTHDGHLILDSGTIRGNAPATTADFSSIEIGLMATGLEATFANFRIVGVDATGVETTILDLSSEDSTTGEKALIASDTTVITGTPDVTISHPNLHTFTPGTTSVELVYTIDSVTSIQNDRVINAFLTLSNDNLVASSTRHPSNTVASDRVNLASNALSSDVIRGGMPNATAVDTNAGTGWNMTNAVAEVAGHSAFRLHASIEGDGLTTRLYDIEGELLRENVTTVPIGTTFDHFGLNMRNTSSSVVTWHLYAEATETMNPNAHPTNLEAISAEDSQVRLTWSPVASATHHEFRYREVGANAWSEWATTNTSTSHTVSLLTNGVTYEFQVRGHDGTTASLASAIVTAMPIALPILELAGITAGSSHDFGTVPHNYTIADLTPLAFTVTNTGAASAENVVVQVSNGSFNLSGETSVANLLPDGRLELFITPALFLASGLHSAVVTVTSDHFEDMVFDVNFNVIAQEMNADWGELAYHFNFANLPTDGTQTGAGAIGSIPTRPISERHESIRTVAPHARQQDFEMLIGIGTNANNGFRSNGTAPHNFIDPNGAGRLLGSSHELQGPIRVELDVLAVAPTLRSQLSLYFGDQIVSFPVTGTPQAPSTVIIEFPSGEGLLRTSAFPWGANNANDPIGRVGLQAIRIYEGTFTGPWIEAENESITFRNLPYGYTENHLATEYITITNVGSETTPIVAEISEGFEIVQAPTATLEAGATTTIGIRPSIGLESGTHLANLIVAATNSGNRLTVPVEVTINEPLVIPTDVTLFYDGQATSTANQFPNTNEIVAWDHEFRRLSFVEGSHLIRFNGEVRDADASLAIPFILNETLWVPLAAAQAALPGLEWAVIGSDLTVTNGATTYDGTALIATEAIHGGNAIFVAVEEISERLNVGNFGSDATSNTWVVVSDTTVSSANVLYNNINNRPESWYGSPNSIQIATNFVYMQRANGGWPRGIGQINALPHQPDIGGMAPETVQMIALGANNEDSYFGRGITTNETRFLLRMYEATGIERFREAGLRGFDTIIRTQDPIGGWPYQISGGSYHRALSISDNAISHLLWLLMDIESEGIFVDTLGEIRVEQAIHSLELGMDWLLNTQVRSAGFADGVERLTAWPMAVYQSGVADFNLVSGATPGVTGQPAWQREFEPMSINGNESVDIIRFLMSIPNPSEEIREAIHSAVYFFEYIRIDGYRLNHASGLDPLLGRNLVPEVGARPLWPRFIDLENFEPLFYDRTGPFAGTVSPHQNVSIADFEATSGAWLGYRSGFVSANATSTGTDASAVRAGTLRNLYRDADGNLTTDRTGEFDLVASFHNLSFERRSGFNYINHFAETLPAEYAAWLEREGIELPPITSPELEAARADLQALINYVEALNAEDFTPESWALVMLAVEFAEAALLSNELALIILATHTLQDSIDALVATDDNNQLPEPTPSPELIAAIDAFILFVEAMLAVENLNYTEDSWEVFEATRVVAVQLLTVLEAESFENETAILDLIAAVKAALMVAHDNLVEIEEELGDTESDETFYDVKPDGMMPSFPQVTPPSNNNNQGGNHSRPTLPQTGMALFSTVTLGLGIVLSGIAVVAKKKQK